MLLRHGNRIRNGGGGQIIRDLQAAEAGTLVEDGPTEAEVRQRAHEIYLSRNGFPGNALLDWVQAEIELRARKAKRPQPSRQPWSPAA